jgi:hypothetical protein
MAQQANLQVATRSDTGKGAARSLRRTGKVPGVIYGHNRQAEALAIGHSLFVRDVKIEKAEILNDPDTPVCTVVAPRTEEAPAVVEEVAAPTEPELIRKPKPEEEGEAEPKA